jgi:hypothetical protein
MSAVRPHPNRVGDQDLAELHALRDRLRSVFEAPREEDSFDRLNAVLAEAGVAPRIAIVGGASYR